MQRIRVQPVAKFIVPDWGDKVNSCIRLSYRPYSKPVWPGATIREPHAGVNFISLPQSGTMNLATVLLVGSKVGKDKEDQEIHVYKNKGV